VGIRQDLTPICVERQAPVHSVEPVWQQFLVVKNELARCNLGIRIAKGQAIADQPDQVIVAGIIIGTVDPNVTDTRSRPPVRNFDTVTGEDDGRLDFGELEGLEID